MAKEPRAGTVKTRLCPPLTPRQAAQLYHAFLADTVERAVGTGSEVVVHGTCETPEALEARRMLETLEDGHLGRICSEAGARLVAQVQGHLGARMQAAIASELAECPRVVVIGADSPDLPLDRIAQSVEALRDVDVCLGPARDGGYYLLAARIVPTAILGSDIPWSSEAVLSASRERLETEGIEYAELDPWDDVDDAASLQRLVRRMAPEGAELGDAKDDLARTRSALASIGLC